MERNYRRWFVILVCLIPLAFLIKSIYQLKKGMDDLGPLLPRKTTVYRDIFKKDVPIDSGLTYFSKVAYPTTVFWHKGCKCDISVTKAKIKGNLKLNEMVTFQRSSSTVVAEVAYTRSETQALYIYNKIRNPGSLSGIHLKLHGDNLEAKSADNFLYYKLSLENGSLSFNRINTIDMYFVDRFSRTSPVELLLLRKNEFIYFITMSTFKDHFADHCSLLDMIY